MYYYYFIVFTTSVFLSPFLHVCSVFVPPAVAFVSSQNFFFIISISLPLHFFFILLSFFFVSHPPSSAIDTHTSSCPMVLTTTAPPAPLTCTATGGARGQPPPSPSSPPHHHPPPPPPAPPDHGHAPPQLCYQTTLPTARWGPWFHHQKCRVGRFVCSPQSTAHPSNMKALISFFLKVPCCAISNLRMFRNINIKFVCFVRVCFVFVFLFFLVHF